MFVDISPDGSRLATGGIDKFVKLWDVKTGQRLFSLPGHKGEIYAVAFSPIGEVFASSGEKGEVLFWQIYYTPTP